VRRTAHWGHKVLGAGKAGGYKAVDWTTRDEIRFIDGLGTWTGARGRPRRTALLEGYLRSLETRAGATFDREACRAHAVAALRGTVGIWPAPAADAHEPGCDCTSCRPWTT
jgi:hypothetical protein